MLWVTTLYVYLIKIKIFSSKIFRTSMLGLSLQLQINIYNGRWDAIVIDGAELLKCGWSCTYPAHWISHPALATPEVLE